MGDDSSNTRVVLWDVNHIALIEKGDLAEGTVVEISSVSVRNGEIHLSAFSDIRKSEEKLGDVLEQQVLRLGKLCDAKPGLNMKVRAVIVQSFEPKHFESKKNPGEKGVLLNVVLDDGTENIRAVLFGETIKKLGLSDDDLSSAEKFNLKKMDLLGEEMVFSGNFRTNKFFNNTEMSVNDVEKVEVSELVRELEAKV